MRNYVMFLTIFFFNLQLPKTAADVNHATRNDKMSEEVKDERNKCSDQPSDRPGDREVSHPIRVGKRSILDLDCHRHHY